MDRKTNRNTLGRVAMAALSALALGLGATACSRDYTVAYVYAVSATTGNVSAFASDYQSGSLTQIPGSPFTTGLTNPTTLVVAPNSKYVYVVGGSQDDKVVEMAIGTDGKLYGQHTYTITGHIPSGVTIDATGSFLYVTFTYQTGYTTVSPGPGGVTIFPINSDGSLGTAITQNLGNNPVGVAAGASSTSGTTYHFVYILDADVNGSGTGAGQLLGFTQNPTTGVLTPVTGTTLGTSGGKTTATGFSAGVVPSAIVIDPTGRWVYVTDRSTNQLFGYLIAGATSPGSLTPMTGNPYLTGLYPVGLTIDPRGKFLYAANFSANTVSAYAIDPASGNPAGVVGVGNTSVATGPTCVSVEPALGIYLYTSNRLDGSISGNQLDPHNGSLKAIENTPFQASTQLSCVATAANGEHASSLVQP